MPHAQSLFLFPIVFGINMEFALAAPVSSKEGITFSWVLEDKNFHQDSNY